MRYTTLSIFVIIAAAVSCKKIKADTAYSSSIDFDNQIHEPKIQIFQENNKVIAATSKYLFKNEGKDAILVGDVVSNFFNEHGAQISTLFSDSAIVENYSNNLKAFGNVKVISDSGYTLFSDRIYWNNQYKLVTSDDSVMFTNSYQDTMYGVGFESDVDLTSSKIFKPYGIVKERNKK